MCTLIKIVGPHWRLSRALLLYSVALSWCLGCSVIFTEPTGGCDVEARALATKVMVLNSNATIKKYKVAQDEFVKEFGADRVRLVDLGEPQWTTPIRVKDMLYDEYPDLVYCIGTKAYLLANKYIPNCQIVFSSTINWRRLPKNEKACGVASEFNAAQQLSYYHNVLPHVKKIGVLYSDRYNKQWFEAARKMAKEHGIELKGKAVKNSAQVMQGIGQLLDDCDVFWLISDPLVIPTEAEVKCIMSACEKKKVPVLTYHRGFKGIQPVMIVLVDAGTVGRQIAGIVNDLLKGHFECDRIKDPIGSSQIFNQGKAEKFKLDYNRDALSIFDEVID